ncbi:hypothetical protein GGP41_010223 [Bipolaris sorokiniana]|uniref:Uncharacterized protein n=1 Tax=Cochliobolus sativus TaxID=45130 RepID=A0A8H5ZMP3_COCSA|nr:hypothetical protein GGP41_010223 [Bipolaris sorokiniana]
MTISEPHLSSNLPGATPERPCGWIIEARWFTPINTHLNTRQRAMFLFGDVSANQDRAPFTQVVLFVGACS